MLFSFSSWFVLFFGGDTAFESTEQVVDAEVCAVVL